MRDKTAIAKRSLFAFLIIFISPLLFSQTDESIINDPSFSLRCEYLINQRKTKMTHKNKIFALLNKNRQLRKNLDPRKHTIDRKLKINFLDLSRELYLTRQKLMKTEEDIVRKGCPGIKL